MPRILVKIGKHYVIRSTIVDAPVSEAFTREEMTSQIQDYDFHGSMSEWLQRIERCDKHGTNLIEPPTSAQEYTAYNRAGPKESCLTWQQLLDKYGGTE